MVSAPTRVCLLVVATVLAHSELAVAQSDDDRSDQGAVPQRHFRRGGQARGAAKRCAKKAGRALA